MNQNKETIHHMVNRVKHKKEVGINYMKSWEMEQMAREEGRMEDIVKAARDEIYRKALLKEFGLE